MCAHVTKDPYDGRGQLHTSYDSRIVVMTIKTNFLVPYLMVSFEFSI